MARCRTRRITAICAAFVATLAPSVTAHDAHRAGPYRLVIGWGDEPAFTAIRNSVVVEITEEGKGPIADLGGGSLVADVSFGNERAALPLQPDPLRRHVFHAWIVPTRAGTYAFHISGRVRNQAIDITTTCSSKTFDCVVDSTEIQFPARDPSVGQVAERLNRSLPRAEQALETAARAQTIAYSAIAVAAFTLVVGIAFNLRSRKGS